MRVCLLSENVSEPSHFNMNHGVETVRLNSWFICAIKGYLDRGREGWQPSSFENVVGEYQPVTNSKLSLPAPMQGQQSERTSDREGDERQIRAESRQAKRTFKSQLRSDTCTISPPAHGLRALIAGGQIFSVPKARLGSLIRGSVGCRASNTARRARAVRIDSW
jgi:hypothetical protein